MYINEYMCFSELKNNILEDYLKGMEYYRNININNSVNINDEIIAILIRTLVNYISDLEDRIDALEIESIVNNSNNNKG